MPETVAVFDTVKYLTDAGIAQKQAEAIAYVHRTAADTNLVTKADLKADLATTNERITQVEANLKVDLAATNERIVQVEANLKVDIADLKVDLAKLELSLLAKIETIKTETIKWVASTIFAAAAITIATLTLILG